MELLVQKANVQSPEQVVIFPSLVDAELEHDPEISKRMLEVQRLQELVDSGKNFYKAGVVPPKADQHIRDLHNAKEKLNKAKDERRGDIEKHIRQRLVDQARAQVAQTEDKRKVLEAQKKDLEKEVKDKSQEAERIGTNSFELETRRNEVEQAEAIIKSLRAEKERLAIEIQLPNKRRVTTRYEAEEPKSPNRSVQLQLALAGGIGVFLLALGGVSYWELRAQRITGSEEVVQDLGMRVIGSLPALSDRSRSLRSQDGERPDWDALLIESIDSIRTMLLCDENTSAHRVLMVTSAKNGEGKTTLAGHLATSMARTGRRTLLIDCDLRRPSVHHLFGTESHPGLSEVLGGDVEISEAIVPSPFTDLAILQAGPKAQEMIPALAQGRMQGVLDALRSQYDFIIIDSCPVLPVADALLIGKSVDAVLLAVRPHVSQTPLLWAACERLSVLGIRVLGAVVSGAETRPHDYVYQYFLESRT
jgi:capsular exopolysaccharide synthesis family protein